MGGKSIDDMKRELVNSGYYISFTKNGSRKEVRIFAPDEWEYEDKNLESAISMAYKHLLDSQELEALRTFIRDINASDSDGYINDSWVSDTAYELSQEYNITTEEDSEVE